MSKEKHLQVMADLARSDINIFSVHVEGGALVVEYEYGWKPTEYKTKWTKAVYILDCITTPLDDVYEHIIREVNSIRAELS